MEIHFEKWHGCHNDFIIIHNSCEQKNNILPSLQKAAKYLWNKLKMLEKGNISLLEQALFAVVGTRFPSDYGKETCQYFVKTFQN